MANAKTFRINPEYGVPDREIREWLRDCEKEEGCPINVTTVLVPAMGPSDPRLTILVTRVDDIVGGG